MPPRLRYFNTVIRCALNSHLLSMRFRSIANPRLNFFRSVKVLVTWCQLESHEHCTRAAFRFIISAYCCRVPCATGKHSRCCYTSRSIRPGSCAPDFDEESAQVGLERVVCLDGVDIEFLPEGTHGKSTLCLVSCFSGGLTRELCIILDRERLVWDGEVEAGCQNGKDGISVVVLLGFLSTQYLSPL